LVYLSARKFGKAKGYSAEWVAKRTREENREKAVEILKTWTHQSRIDKCLVAKVQELWTKKLLQLSEQQKSGKNNWMSRFDSQPLTLQNNSA